MPFQFTCPHCFNKTLVDESYVGQVGPCASCSKTVTITEPPKKLKAVRRNAVQTSDSALARSNRQQESRLLQHPLVRRLLLAIFSAVGLILIGLICWKAFSALSGIGIVQKIQQRSAQTQCMNNLSRIARALSTYAATHGAYPPAVTYDKDGKPMHSWRVLILQELGEYDTHNKYKFDEPWDSPDNSTLVGTQCPRVFISPARPDHQYAAESSYFLVVGDGTIFPSTTPPLTPSQIRDGQDNTLIVVEAQNTSHVWTEPIDVDFRNLKGTANSVGIGGTHTQGFTAGFADGTSAWIPNDTPTEQIRSLITVNGNEPVDRSLFTKQ